MKVVINPYHKSVTIDGVEVVQKFINFPDALNHLASISCDYDRDSQTITDVQDVHRYVSHAIEKQYYYKHLPEFVDWFYAEQQAQLDNAISVEQQIIAANTAAQNAATSAEKAKLEAEEAKKTNQNTQQAVDNAVAKITQAGSTLPVKSDGTDVARTLGERFADVVNVKDFGAVGDGATDDTVAIQAAIAAGQGRTIKFPAGVYIFAPASSVILSKGTILDGESKETVHLVQPDTDILLPYFFVISGENVSILNMTFTGGRKQSNMETATGRSGVVKALNAGNFANPVIRNCSFSDFGESVIWLACSGLSVTKCVFTRCGKFTHKIPEMYGCVSTWISGEAPVHDVEVSECRFADYGEFAVAMKNVHRLIENGNSLVNGSCIGLGHQWCSQVTISGNNLYKTYNSGIDVQQCDDVVITSNTLTNCASGFEDGNIYQAIFVGDDSGNRPTSNVVISSNVVRGTWTQSAMTEVEPANPEYTGAGIVLNNVQTGAVVNNTLVGIGKPYTPTLVANEDGNGIRCMNDTRDVRVAGNTCKECKRAGIYIGTGSFENISVFENTVKVAGLYGIELCAVSKAIAIRVDNNIIADIQNVFDDDSSAGVLLSTVKSTLSQCSASGNTIYATVAESDNSSKFPYGIYVGVSSYLSDATFCGLANLFINDNIINGAGTPIAFWEGCYSSSSSRHNRMIRNNRTGNINSGDYIHNIPNRKSAIEFVAANVPTTGSYKIGDICMRQFPSNNPIGWVCISEGTPGTWRELRYVIPS